MCQIWAPIRTQNYAFLLHNLKGPARVIEHTGLAFGGITGARIMRKTFQVAPSCEGACRSSPAANSLKHQKPFNSIER
jgi:hypothetical protein